ncbi:substrate-binding domain-containing protein [Kitasatospora sp. NPDC006697]|uniref:substrate-binding domain-containing protein n=1 Tax=Kitasatospora sp. NPDC006697 TaxID=3364020 RepID=UPI0036AA5AA2
MSAPLTRRTALTALAGALLAGAAGCTSGSAKPPAPSSPSPSSPPAGTPVPSGSPATLRVLGSSELSDLQPVLDDAAKATGVTVKLDYTATQSGAGQVSQGQAEQNYDALWFSSNRYLRLDRSAADKLLSETPTMVSPVCFGVRTSALTALGWDPQAVSWAQIGDAVARGRLSYGMTDPSKSNSGLSALIGVATAFSHARSALTAQDIVQASAALHTFFGGQKLIADSSGWLAQAYQHAASTGTGVDALINYESVLLEYNRTLPNDAQLTVVRPTDGVVSADYPLTLLSSAAAPARDAFRRLTGYLLRPEVQKKITDTTERRPITAGVSPGPGLADLQLPELPFPGDRSVVDGLVNAYQNQLRRPSRTVYALDTSGSMRGDRLAALQSALGRLTGADGRPSPDGFREREEVTLISFATAVKWSRTHRLPDANPQAELAAIDADVKSLAADGDTAIYSALEAAYQQLAQQQAAAQDDRFTSIVLMTDGENNEGATADQFTAFHHALPAAQQSVPVFPIRFGEAAVNQLQAIADLTGGKLFDGMSGSLDDVFEEIRGYQ